MSGSKFFNNNNLVIKPVSTSDPVSSEQSSQVRQIHKLPNSWCLWHHYNSGKPQAPVQQTTTQESTTTTTTHDDLDKYLQDTNLLSFPKFEDPSIGETTEIDSIEQFWQVSSNLVKFEELKTGSHLMIFKSGIKPIWEDPINSNGGRWLFKFSKKSVAVSDRKRSILIWERVLLKVLSGNFISQDNLFKKYLEDDIAGIVLSIRKDEDIVSIWNKNRFIKGYSKDLSEIKKRLSLKLQETIEAIELEQEQANHDDSYESDEEAEEEEEQPVEEQESEEPQLQNQDDDSLNQDLTISNIEEAFKNQIVLTSFIGRRGISESMVRIIKEAQLIIDNETEVENGVKESINILTPIKPNDETIESFKVKGFISLYRLHGDSNPKTSTHNHNSLHNSYNNHNNHNNHTHHNNHNNHNNSSTGHSYNSKYQRGNSRRYNNNNRNGIHVNGNEDDENSNLSMRKTSTGNGNGNVNSNNNNNNNNSRRKVAMGDVNLLGGVRSTSNSNSTSSLQTHHAKEENKSSTKSDQLPLNLNLGSNTNTSVDVGTANAEGHDSSIDSGVGLMNFSSRRRRLKQI